MSVTIRKLARSCYCAVLVGLVCGTSSALGQPFTYITNLGTNSVIVIDPATNILAGSIKVGAAPDGIAVNQVGTRVYVANGNDNTVSIIDTATNTVIQTVKVGSVPQGIAVNRLATRVYVTNLYDDTVSVIDTGTGKVVATIPVGGLPVAIALNPSETQAYVANYHDGTISIIDTGSNTVTDKITVGTGLGVSQQQGAVPSGPTSVAFNPAGTHAYVTSQTDPLGTPQVGTLNDRFIDTSTNHVFGGFDVSNGIGVDPSVVAINPAGTRAYITNTQSDTVSVIDTNGDGVIAIVPVGHQPLGVTVDLAGTAVYVANFGDGTISVIDVATNRVTVTLPVGGNPNLVAKAETSSNVCAVNTTCSRVVALSSPHIGNVQVIVQGPCLDMSSEDAMASLGCNFREGAFASVDDFFSTIGCSVFLGCSITLGGVTYSVKYPCADMSSLAAMDRNGCSYQTYVPLCPGGATCNPIIDGIEYTVQGPCDDMSSLLTMNDNHCTYVVTPQACAAGTTCWVTLDGTEYRVTGPCADMSSVSAMNKNACEFGVFQVCDLYGCGNTVVDPHLTLLNDAAATISSLRGISNDSLNGFRSSGEITAYMYLRLLKLAKTSPGGLSSDDAGIVRYYEEQIHEDRVAVAQEAVDLYSSLISNPCAFKVPVGDPNAYVDSPAVHVVCHAGQLSQFALTGAESLPVPSAEEFTAWAEGAVHQMDVADWVSTIQAQHPELTAAQAAAIASFEYDQARGELEEGESYLNAIHADLGPPPITSTATAAESDLEGAWKEGVGDFASDQVTENIKDTILEIPEMFIDAVFEDAEMAALSAERAAISKLIDDAAASAAAGDIVGAATYSEQATARWAALETTFAEQAAEEAEDTLGTVLEVNDTIVGPVLAVAAALTYITWQDAEDAGVPTTLNNALADAKNNHTLKEYTATATGRARILDAVVKSNLPSGFTDRIADPSFGNARSAGPDSQSDPVFTFGCVCGPLANTFQIQDWERGDAEADVAKVDVSIRDGWFIQTPDTPDVSNNSWQYVPAIRFIDINGDYQRAWLDGLNFITQRFGVPAGFAQVYDGVNGCNLNAPLFPQGNIDYGFSCVIPFGPPGTPFAKPIHVGDTVYLLRQVREVANVVTDGSGNVTSFITSKPFEPPSDPEVGLGGAVVILAHPNGNCFTSSSLGSRASGPDCTKASGLSPASHPSVYLMNPPKLTITASSKSITNGDAVPAITPGYSGFTDGDTASSLANPPLTAPPVCSTTYLPGDPPGTYLTQCSGAQDGKYFIIYVNGSLTVNPVGGGSSGNGIPASVENGVPSHTSGLGISGGTGDGNGDGIQDSLQPNVASLPTGAGGGYATLVSVGGRALANVVAGPATSPTAAPLPSGAITPYGQFGFTATGVAPGATELFALYLPYDPSINGILKHNRVTGGWDNVAQSIALDGNKTLIVFSVQNGGPYDADGNGSDNTIQDPVIPAILPNGVCPSSDVTFHLHGFGSNPAQYTLLGVPPTAGGTAKYLDSPALKRTGAYPYPYTGIGTWGNGYVGACVVDAISDLHVWLGLRNSDDQGANFDLKADVLFRSASAPSDSTPIVVATAEHLCVKGATRNPALAEDIAVHFPTPAHVTGSGQFFLALSTRIASPGCGGHANATGLRVYYDAPDRDSRFDVEYVQPDN